MDNNCTKRKNRITWQKCKKEREKKVFNKGDEVEVKFSTEDGNEWYLGIVINIISKDEYTVKFPNDKSKDDILTVNLNLHEMRKSNFKYNYIPNYMKEETKYNSGCYLNPCDPSVWHNDINDDDIVYFYNAYNKGSRGQENNDKTKIWLKGKIIAQRGRGGIFKYKIEAIVDGEKKIFDNISKNLIRKVGREKGELIGGSSEMFINSNKFYKWLNENCE